MERNRGKPCLLSLPASVLCHRATQEPGQGGPRLDPGQGRPYVLMSEMGLTCMPLSDTRLGEGLGLPNLLHPAALPGGGAH